MFLRIATIAVAALVLAGAARADGNLAAGLAQARAGDRDAALAAMARIDTQPARDVVMWTLLRARKGTFAEGREFLRRNPDWPGLDLLQARVEPTIPATAAPDAILEFFDGRPPRTSKGALMLATALRAKGRAAEAETLAIETWLAMPMPSSSQAGFLQLFGEVLEPFHAARLDAMAWSGDLQSAERVLPLVAGPEAALARARIALRDGRPGVDDLIEAVPEVLRDHPGLAYERFRWRLEKDRREDALELLFAFDESADSLGRPEAWGQHRERLARGLKQDGFPEEAYRVAARHHLPEGHRAVAGNEWLAGYVALRFRDDAAAAAAHFRRFDAAVASPISKGRAGYWLGRALEETGDSEGAAEAYAAGARYQTSFYGQLAAERAGLPADPRLAGTETFPPVAETSFFDSSVLAAALELRAVGEMGLAERFMAHLAESLPRAEIGSLIDLALDLDEPHIALIVAKRAAQAGHELHAGYFPVTDLAAEPGPVAPELVLSIARRESEFDPSVVSPAGARGLMQVMPGTAREMAELIGAEYRQGALTSDPDYNARLGTAYLGELEAEFGLSPVLVPAAYNAGPSRARRWSRQKGHPGAPGVDVVDWIEDVPFSETRNYIMRVSESLLPYHARLNGAPAEVRLSRWLREGYDELADPAIKATRGD
ncbi:lytic transglycosylase domain-containing protein [Jannaschia ovalis]|uniref:Lytic transglycosylase domain-containing protein n=1 Tax=Jannaschia ovalis TaxID=3038773 RepID=A0ABY8LH27_9RHOB|nr:lytic transglycosylase domain-containing protein [Jannaschia sp. GRR-S6-38]WGH79445.1 lytic transglycosylase domain-containing protein [Jannaschia sp. GRR-S6-38]